MVPAGWLIRPSIVWHDSQTLPGKTDLQWSSKVFNKVGHPSLSWGNIYLKTLIFPAVAVLSFKKQTLEQYRNLKKKKSRDGEQRGEETKWLSLSFYWLIFSLASGSSRVQWQFAQSVRWPLKTSEVSNFCSPYPLSSFVGKLTVTLQGCILYIAIGPTPTFISWVQLILTISLAHRHGREIVKL